MTATAKTEVKADILATLLKNAVDCTFYVATGNVMARELAEKHKITLDEAKNLLSVVACEVVDKIRTL